MKIQYYPETDSLYIDLTQKMSANSKELENGVVLDFDDQGDLVGIDVDWAAKKIDLTTLETLNLPLSEIA